MFGECGIIILKKNPGDSNHLHFNRLKYMSKEKNITKKTIQDLLNNINKKVYSQEYSVEYT